MSSDEQTPPGNDQLVIDVLRAAGHEDAANLASTIITRQTAPKKPAAEETESDTGAAATGMSLFGPQSPEAEGRYMLNAIQRMRKGSGAA